MTVPAVGLSVSQTMVAYATGWPWGCFDLVLLLSVAFYLLCDFFSWSMSIFVIEICVDNLSRHT